MRNKILILTFLLASMLVGTIANAQTREPKQWNGWWNNGDYWEYYSDNSKLTNGWNKIENEWYFFDTDGSRISGWKEIKNKWYFFNPNNGKMAHDTYVGNYYVGSGGTWNK